MTFEFFRKLNEGKIHSHLEFQDMDISVEVPAGGARKGVNKKTGEAWEHKIDDHYGYIKGTHSPDGEHLDCYVKKNPKKDAKVYVVHQLTVDGSKFDEDKVMLGYNSASEATRAFKKFTFKPETMFGGITEFDIEHFLVVAYQASSSKAMLTDRATYADFVKRGLMPKGIHSPLTIARRVSESLAEGLSDISNELNGYDIDLDESSDDSSHLSDVFEEAQHIVAEIPAMTNSYVVAVHTQIMENIGSKTNPQWATAGTKFYKVAEAADYGAARAIAARVAAGEIPVDIAEGEYVLGIDAIPLSEFRQFYESTEESEDLEESVDSLDMIKKLAGVTSTNEDATPRTPRDWANRLAALEENQHDHSIIEAKKAKKNEPQGRFVGWPWWYPHNEHTADDSDTGSDFGGDAGGMGESQQSESTTPDNQDAIRIRNLEMMWGVDQKYIDKFLGEPEPECTCDPYQLNQVGCDCDQDSWRYAQWVDQQRKKFGLVKDLNEGSFRGMSLEDIYAEIINTDYYGVDMTDDDYARAEAKAEEIWNSYQD